MTFDLERLCEKAIGNLADVISQSYYNHSYQFSKFCVEQNRRLGITGVETKRRIGNRTETTRWHGSLSDYFVKVSNEN